MKNVKIFLRCLNYLLEHGFVDTADGASPVIRQICESRSGSDAVLGITLYGIISVTAGIAEIFIHSSKSSFYLSQSISQAGP